MEILTAHPWSWLILGLLIISLIYTSIVVKEEQTSYVENAQKLNIESFEFLIPSWWKVQKKSTTNYCFERHEKTYDWEGTIVIDQPTENLFQYYADYLKTKNIILDETDSIIQNKDHLSKKFINIITNDILHIESTGTQDDEKRIYLSSYLISTNKKLIVANGLSSVLNGMLEGPYFEEVLYGVKLVVDA